MAENMSFEKAMAELEKTVSKLENGNLPLEQALGLYEKGIALVSACEEKLKKAELKIKEIGTSTDEEQ